MEVTCSDLCFKIGVRKLEPMDQFQPKIPQSQREGAGEGAQGCVASFPLPHCFFPPGDLDLGWDGLNVFGGPSLLPLVELTLGEE